jgi:hypothetical protein
VDAATPFRDADHTQNLTRAERKRTIVEELVEDADSRRYVLCILSVRWILTYPSGTRKRNLETFNLYVVSAVEVLWHANLQSGSRSGEHQVNTKTLIVARTQSRQHVLLLYTLTMVTFRTTQDKESPSGSNDATSRRLRNSTRSRFPPFECCSRACAEFRQRILVVLVFQDVQCRLGRHWSGQLSRGCSYLYDLPTVNSGLYSILCCVWDIRT